MTAFSASAPATATRARRAQAAVETMLALPLLMMVLMGTYYLFTITFAAENAHLRAREYVLHENAYLGSRAYNVSGSSVWDGDNYRKAERGVHSYSYRATSSDSSITGMESTGRQTLRANAAIRSD
jgi:hypothetical protein